MRLPTKFTLNDMVSFALTVTKDIVDFEPKKYKDSIGSKRCVEWSKTMEEEMNSLKKNQNWVLEDKPKR